MVRQLQYAIPWLLIIALMAWWAFRKIGMGYRSEAGLSKRQVKKYREQFDLDGEWERIQREQKRDEIARLKSELAKIEAGNESGSGRDAAVPETVDIDRQNSR